MTVINKIANISLIIFDFCTRRLLWNEITITRPFEEFHKGMAEITPPMGPLSVPPFKKNIDKQMEDVIAGSELGCWLNQAVGSNNYNIGLFRLNFNSNDELGLVISIRFRNKDDAAYTKLAWG